MNAPPRDYQTTYDAVTALWPDLDLPRTTDNGTELRWYFSLGGPILTWAQINGLGKQPATQARNVLKRTSDLWVVGKVGGSRVIQRRVVEEPSWRAGILDVVPPEVIKCVTMHLTERPL